LNVFFELSYLNYSNFETVLNLFEESNILPLTADLLKMFGQATSSF